MMRNWPRHDLVTFDLGKGWEVEVYRRDDQLGQGVCMSLNHRSAEIMRFDLFDPAHEHWGVLDSQRMYYPKGWTREQYIDLAVNNLVRHAAVPAKLSGRRPPSRVARRDHEEAIRAALLERA